MSAIDYLCTLFTPEFVEQEYFGGDDNEWLRSLEATGRDAYRGFTPGEFRERLSALGVERVMTYVPVTWDWGPRRLVSPPYREEIVAVTKAHPDFFYGIYGIDPYSRMDGVDELERYVREYGFRAAHIHPHGFNLTTDHAFYFPFYAKCHELGIPVIVVTGTTIGLFPIAVAQPIYLDMVAQYFPNLKIVCCHTGTPWVREAIALAVKHENLYIGCAAHAPRYWEPELVRFIDSRRGRHKVLWGTDYPIIDHGRSLAEIDALELRPESKAALLYENAARVFAFE
jgi:predicted TIM-barrel fold metal-dependent hydrolase